MAEPIVSIKQGKLKGITDTDMNGDNYFKFLGIPYAKPPIGPLRFKASQPADSWTGIRDASKEGSPCLYMDMISSKLVGSEDCLYLNIYTKQLARASISLKPVMVFIHGGAFTMGSGSQQMHGSKYLVSQDVVLVTLNYRLGIFGFLSSDDLSLEIPGNAGLKDQTFALKWIHDNISNFGGDPNNVTIFGVSAGGASVHFQVLTPTSKGLFHKAIAQSGVSLNPWAWGQKNATLVAEKLGRRLSNDKDALDVLMNATAQEVFEASQKIPDVLLDATKRRPFGPVIEKPNPTAFLTENPRDLLASGKFNQVPLIQGITSNEGFFYEFQRKESEHIKLRELGAFWYFNLSEEQRSKIKSLLGDLYFKNGESPDGIYEVISDVIFLAGIIEATKLTVKTSHNPVYLYVFSYEVSVGKLISKFLGIEEDKIKGVSHGGDLMFLFNSQLGGLLEIPPLEPKMQEEIHVAVKQVIKIWTDFARFGRPHENWEPVEDLNELKYFNIDKESTLRTNPFYERIAVWEKIFKEMPSMDFCLQEKPTL